MGCEARICKISANVKVSVELKSWAQHLLGELRTDYIFCVSIKLNVRNTFSFLNLKIFIDSWSKHSPLDQAGWVQALARDIVFCYWALNKYR